MQVLWLSKWLDDLVKFGCFQERLFKPISSKEVLMELGNRERLPPKRDIKIHNRTQKVAHK